MILSIKEVQEAIITETFSPFGFFSQVIPIDSYPSCGKLKEHCIILLVRLVRPRLKRITMRNHHALLVQICLSALLCSRNFRDQSGLATAFYLPGIAMKEYAPGDKVEVLANRLTSPTSALPFSYYSLPFCKPPDLVKSKPVNLGQILVGERAFPTPFKIAMNQDQKCSVLCQVNMASIDSKDIKRLKDRISENYVARLNADNMPLVTKLMTKTGQLIYKFGYPIGYRQDDSYFIYNHLSLKILYHQPSLRTGEAFDALTAEGNTYRIVGFEVKPRSIKHVLDTNGSLPESACEEGKSTEQLSLDSDTNVVYSYDVSFEESELAWATRWDPILNVNAEIKQVQWFSIINSLMVSLFLTALVATVMLRTVLKDFGRYNVAQDDVEEDDMTGWKYCHADVFRPPAMAPVLSVCVGCGAQVFVMASLTLAFALFGFLSPANRGGLLTALLSLWVLSSAVSGYVSSHLYSAIGTEVPRRAVTFSTAFVFPGITFAIFFSLNLVMWYMGSSGSVPFTTLLLLLFMWFGMSVPLVFIGAYIAYQQKPITFPTRTNQIKRQIPSPPLGIPPIVYAVLAGILPFGTVFMELVVILNTVWSGSVYYLYGALVAVFALLVVTCAEMSIVSTYLSLSAEDWASHWHTSFWGSAAAGLYVFLYSLYFAAAQRSSVQVPFVSQLVFVCWSLVVSGAFALMCGCVGFMSSLWFTRKIYQSIRID